MVELRQVSEHAGKPGVVGATPHQTHGENGVPCHRGVTVVRELSQRVQDGQLGVRDREEGQGQGHSTANHRVTVVQLHRKEATMRGVYLAKVRKYML